jgi:hypothetical protein
MTATSMVELLMSKGTPDTNKTFPPEILSLVLQTPIKMAFDKLVDQVVDATCTHQAQRYKESNRDLVRLLLVNLIHAAFRFENLSLPTKIITKGYYHKLGFSQLRMERIRDYLIDNNFMRLTRVGFRHVKNPTKNRPAQYFPTQKFLLNYSDILYAEYGDFDQYLPYEYKDESIRWDPKESESVKILRQYNTMMKQHTWAMKSPTVRKLGLEPFTSGRVYTHYQNIVNRRIPIRSQTLLDGEPIVECDFVSNHPYMIAKLTGNEFDSDAYRIIADKVGLDRKDVKMIITQALGSKLAKDLNSIKYNLNQIGSLAIDKTIDAAKTQFSWMNDALFNNQGIRLQWLEGEVAIRMFKEAVDHNIPMLCIHDAFGVNIKHQELTSKLMHQHREEVIKENKHRWQQHTTTALR